MAALPADHWSRTPPPVGSTVCMEHGPVTPDRAGFVPVCPQQDCRQLAWKVGPHKQFGQAYAPIEPTHCANGHPHTPGRSQRGFTVCREHRGGGHHTWRCGECGDEQAWPPLQPGCRAVGVSPRQPQSSAS